MAALTQERKTPRLADAFPAYTSDAGYGVAASTTIYAGALVCKNASGYVVPASTSTTQVALGVAEKTVTNSGAAGSVTVPIRTGVHGFNNSSSGDLIAITEIGTDCYIVDDNTVAKTNGTSTRSRAGKVVDVNANGVFVLVFPGL